ncbi:MAG: multiprotein-bridging factor 1 family protein [Candidatus Kapaibacterium sp.]
MIPITRALNRHQHEIATRIKALLEIKGWQQRDLAKKAGLKDSYITRVVQGEANLTLATITLLERALEEPIISTWHVPK